MMPVVVSDTSPLRVLAHLDRLDILTRLFGTVYVPPSVVAELSVATSGVPALSIDRIPGARVQAPTDLPRVRDLRERLGAGESEAIVLALELRADFVLIDESRGRAISERLGLTPLGALGLLVRAKHAGLLPAVAPLIQRLEAGLEFRVSAALRQKILTQAGETDRTASS
jgi:predicted nucleic acid-binding protein